MMKRLISLLLLCALVLSLSACQKEEQKIQEPVNFYYLRQEATYGSADSLITTVIAEGMDYKNDPAGLLNLYLQVPEDSNYRSPFPSGTRIISMEHANSIVRLTLSENFAALTGMDLTIACACLTLTTLDLTGAGSVRISVEGTTLNGSDYIRMDRSCLTLLDTINNETD